VRLYGAEINGSIYLDQIMFGDVEFWDTPPVPDETEDKRLRAIRLATREFRRLAAEERDAHAKLLH
jgi:hypothetical protein